MLTPVHSTGFITSSSVTEMEENEVSVSEAWKQLSLLTSLVGYFRDCVCQAAAHGASALNLLAASASHLCPFHPLCELIYGQIDRFYPEKVLRFFSEAAWHKGLRGNACGLATVPSPLHNLSVSTIIASCIETSSAWLHQWAESSSICNDPELSTPSAGPRLCGCSTLSLFVCL